MKKRIYAGVGASALIAIVALAATVSGALARSGATPLPAASCSGIVNGSGKLLIASDLPLEGSGRTQTSQMTRAIKFIFGQHGWDLAGLRAFDLFPMTHHVECVAILTPTGETT